MSCVFNHVLLRNAEKDKSAEFNLNFAKKINKFLLSIKTKVQKCEINFTTYSNKMAHDHIMIPVIYQHMLL